ncbi:glycosyltransferase [Fusobacterium varium]|uniref:glycosyltransferase n=1 Tax=Fusobacterium varium TaxID=856 RepID=UPI000E408F55|nr:glycosyltransferase [Fusobacterium varium]MCI6032776.1 glycosyltransferase [Fusobacterium varium]RGJ28897.1 glycosyltransferase family 1 protein [Fusobacterium varium]
MNGLFFINETLSESSGISKKILSQVKALKQNGVEIQFSYLVKDKKYTLRKIENTVIAKFQNNIFGKLKMYVSYKNLLNYIMSNDIDFIYIRYTHFSNYFFNRFLKKLKKSNLIIFLEIPTYPYDMEYKNITGCRKIKFLIEKYYRNRMGKNINRIITFSNDDKIFGIKTIKMSNGIDINEISIVNKNVKESINEINFIGVAGIAFWHGFDRFILSMVEYYKNNPKEIVKFHIVGDGDKETVNNLKNLVKENKLEKYVIFYGYKSGKELDEIYNESDIGIGCLGNFRKGLYEGGALKNKEYCAKGLPVVVAGPDYDFNNCEFIYQVSQDESLINIEKIIEWYKNLNMAPEEIRKYAEDNLSWNIQMKKVVESIKELI